MANFRKKPVVIQAVQWDGRADLLSDFMGSSPRFGDGPNGYSVYIDTLEGEHRADPGDWIIRGVKGEYYPCKPDIFEATYEPVT